MGTEGNGSPDGGQGTTPPEGGKQGGSGTSTEGTPPTPPDGGTQESGSDDSKATIARLNREAKENRERAEAAEAKLAEADKAKMSDIERAKAEKAEADQRATKLEQDLREARMESKVKSLAEEAGAIDPDLVWGAFPKGSVRFDDNGQPNNLKDLMSEFKKEHPKSFAKTRGKVDSGARSEGGGGGGGTMSDLIRRGAGR